MLVITDIEWPADMAQIEPEAIGRQPLKERAYLDVGAVDEEDVVIAVTGSPDAAMAA